MPDVVISQAPSADGQVIQGEGQVQGIVPIGNAQAEPQTENKPLTLEDYRLVAREEATRIAQSQVAKGENRIEKRIQEQLAALKMNQGVLGLSDQDVERAKQRIVMKAYDEPEPQAETPTSAPQQPANDADRAIQMMNTGIERAFQRAGASVTTSDPEFKELQAVIDSAWTKPDGYDEIILTADKLARTKAARLKAHQDQAPARVIGGGGSMASVVKTMSPEDKIAKGLREANWNNSAPG